MISINQSIPGCLDSGDDEDPRSRSRSHVEGGGWLQAQPGPGCHPDVQVGKAFTLDPLI